MYCLINNDELVAGKANKLLKQYLLSRHPVNYQSVRKLIKKYKKNSIDRETLNANLPEAIARDLSDWQYSIKQIYKRLYKDLYKRVSNKFSILSDTEDKRQILIDSVTKTCNKNLVKCLAYQIFETPIWTLVTDSIDYQQPMLIRNIINNEKLLEYKIKNNLPFWFVDSGYTNFLYDGRKVWNRIIKNHIHCRSTGRYFPADRLKHLPSFPKKWRSTGNRILVVESSNLYLSLFGNNLANWRRNLLTNLQKYTDRPIDFRPKNMNKKIRTSVFKDLENNDDYYCVVTDSSSAAIEAIWLGIPVITLSKHISNRVSRSKIKDIENLYRGPVGDWLCELTYSQFTFDEICDGTAMSILREFHNV